MCASGKATKSTVRRLLIEPSEELIRRSVIDYVFTPDSNHSRPVPGLGGRERWQSYGEGQPKPPGDTTNLKRTTGPSEEGKES